MGLGSGGGGTGNLCQPSVKNMETSIFSIVERGRSVIRNLRVKIQKNSVISDIREIYP